MNKIFVKELKAFEGEKIDTIKTGQIEGYMLFQFRIKDKLLCVEIANPDYKGGRCFLMSVGAVDGAGIFPL